MSEQDSRAKAVVAEALALGAGSGDDSDYKELRRMVAIVVERGYRMQDPLRASPYAAVAAEITEVSLDWLERTRQIK